MRTSKKIKSLNIIKIFSFGLKICFKHAIRFIISALLFGISLATFMIGYSSYEYDSNVVMYNALMDKDIDVIHIESAVKSEDIKVSDINYNIYDDDVHNLEALLPEFKFGKIYNTPQKGVPLRLPEKDSIDMLYDFDNFCGITYIEESVLANYNLIKTYGEMPIGKNEIVVSQYLAEILVKYGYYEGHTGEYINKIDSMEDVVGTRLYFNMGAYDEWVTIVGILDTGLDIMSFKELESFDESTATMEEYEKGLNLQNLLYETTRKSFHTAIFVSDKFINDFLIYPYVYANYKYINHRNEETIGIARGISQREILDNNLEIVGKTTLADDEILMDKYSLMSYYMSFNAEIADMDNITDEMLAEFLASNSAKRSFVIHDVTAEEYNENLEKEYKIVGYYGSGNFENELEKDRTICLNDKILKENGVSDNLTSSLYTKLSDKEQVNKKLVNVLYGENNNETYNFPIVWELGSELEVASSSYKSLAPFGIIIAVVFLIFSALMMFNFISASIESSQKEIALLSSFGAKKFDIVKIYMLESFFIGIIGLGIAIGLGYLGVSILGQIFSTEYAFDALFITYRQILWSVAIALIMPIAMTLLPIFIILKKSPIEALKG